MTLYIYKDTTSWVYRAGSVGWVAESGIFVGVVRDKIEELGDSFGFGSTNENNCGKLKQVGLTLFNCNKKVAIELSLS